MLKSNGSTTTMNLFAVVVVLFSLPVLILASASPSTTPYQRLIHRRDPLHRFNFYDSGYDITNKHYWASLAFTGVHGYAMAGAWMAFGLGFGLFLIAKNIATPTQNTTTSHHSHSSSYFLFALILIFTLLAITATGFVLATNHKSLREMKRVEREVLGAGEDARREIHRVKRAMRDIQTYLCPYDSNTCALLNTTTTQLGTESLAIKRFVHKDAHFIDAAISLVYMTNLVVVSVNSAFLVAALVFILLHWNLGFVIVIFFCWILTTACWVLTGVDFFLHNFAEDTCAALQTFLIDPKNSSLNSLLPCENLLQSEHILIQIGQTVHDFITLMNSRIIELPKELGLYEPSKYKDSFASPKICDPFSGPPNYTYVQQKCTKDTIPIGQVPHILDKFTCGSSASIPGCLPESYYTIAYAYIRSMQDLIGAYPDVDALIHCSFVKNRLSDAELRHCRPFKSSTTKLWISIVCLSTTMTALVLLWIAKASCCACACHRGTSSSLSSIVHHPTQL